MIYVATRCEDMPRNPPAHMREKGRCELCECEVWINKNGYQESKSKGQDPHVCCMVCYSAGRHTTMIR